MFFNMAISLYTSRVVLNILGIEDYGIYNIVGGVVVLFSFIQNALASATQRFLNFELGKKNISYAKEVFSVSITVHILIIFVIVILSETIGLWFLNSHLSIPPDRMTVAKIVYQFSIVTCCINIIKTPYNASIIAYEKMSVYAYISMLESILRLLIVYILTWFRADKLTLYAILTCLVSFIVLKIYTIYCNKKLDICTYAFSFNKGLIKQVMSFSSWSLLVGVSNVGSTQGINVVLNIFKGVTLNAAMGIASQVSNAIYSFVSNFQVAYSPQIIKLYATGNMECLHRLVFRTSKFSFYLLMIISLPFIICCKDIMNLWLAHVPDYAVIFTQIIIANHLFDAISAPLWLAIQATGKIRNYQIICSVLLLLNIPLALLAMWAGYSPTSVLWIKLVISFILFVFRVPYVGRIIHMSANRFFRLIAMRCLLVTLVAFPLPFWMYHIMNDGWRLPVVIIISIITSAITIFSIGLDMDERRVFLFKIQKIIRALC